MAAIATEAVVDGEPTLPPQLLTLTDLLEDKPEAFADGDEQIRDAGLAAAKFIFDMGPSVLYNFYLNYLLIDTQFSAQNRGHCLPHNRHPRALGSDCVVRRHRHPLQL